MDDRQLLRYSRQIMLPAFGIEGQERLRRARVVVVGLGGLGSPVAMYLAAAGVGRLVLADFDAVDLSNLQRQILHTTERIGTPKAQSARTTLAALNPEVELVLVKRSLTIDTLPGLLTDVDLVVDCCDNFDTRFAVNAACVAARKPLVSGAASGWRDRWRPSPANPADPAINASFPGMAVPTRPAPPMAYWPRCPVSSAASRRPRQSRS